MLTYIESHIVLSCVIVLFALLMLDALACRYGDKTRAAISNTCFILAVIAGIIIFFAVTTETKSLDIGWRILLTIICGPLLGCVIYALRYGIICLWIEFTSSLKKNRN